MNDVRGVGETVDAATRCLVLVEGPSDRAAVETLAERRGRSLADSGAQVVVIGGATTIGAYLDRYGPNGMGLRLTGLVDAAEERFLRRRLDRAGLGPTGDRHQLEQVGFFVCVEDLEDELIRAVGTRRVLEIVEGEHELESFTRFQRQPAQRDRSVEHHLRRFVGTKSGRKVRYGHLLAAALDPERVPLPLDRLLRRVTADVTA